MQILRPNESNGLVPVVKYYLPLPNDERRPTSHAQFTTQKDDFPVVRICKMGANRPFLSTSLLVLNAAALFFFLLGVVVVLALYHCADQQPLPSTTAPTIDSVVVASERSNEASAVHNGSSSEHVEFPTICIFDYDFCSLLPDVTLEALRNSSTTPQSRAFLWSFQTTDQDEEPNVRLSNARRLQRFALATLYYSTDGLHWVDHTNWLSHTHSECNWAGCGCNDDTKALVSLSMDSNDLNGTLPPELGMLTTLDYLAMFLNINTGFDVTGAIPSEVGCLTRLTHLKMQDLGVSGAIPTELGRLSKLDMLLLEGNRLEGPMPTELSQLRNLTFLGLSGNHLHGTLPSQLGTLTQLSMLLLNSNNLTGTLPSTLGNLSQLQTLFLDGNAFTGTLPTQLGQLIYVSELWLSSNQFSGPIPTEFGRMALHLDLMLSHNLLSGTIPTELGMIQYMDPDMSNIYLSDNRLTGSLPSELGRLSTLKTLDVSHNLELIGMVPPALCAQVTRGLELIIDCASVDCGTCGGNCRCAPPVET